MYEFIPDAPSYRDYDALVNAPKKKRIGVAKT
jgi:hypothetical protein